MEWAQELHKATEVRSRNPETESKNKLPPFFYGQQSVTPKTLNSVYSQIRRNSNKRVFCVFQNCGVQSEELGKVLRLLGLKKKRLVNVLPLLEFITWSLLKEDDLVRSPVQATSCKKKF